MEAFPTHIAASYSNGGQQRGPILFKPHKGSAYFHVSSSSLTITVTSVFVCAHVYA